MLLSSTRFPRTQVASVVHVAIFQQQETGRSVLRNLRRAGFSRSALLRASASGKLHESGVSAAGGAAVSAAIGLVVGTLLLWREWLQTGPFSTPGIALILTGFALESVLADSAEAPSVPDAPGLDDLPPPTLDLDVIRDRYPLLRNAL